MDAGHLRRIVEELGGDGPFNALCRGLSPTDLQSLLLEVSRERSTGTRPAQIIQRYLADRFVQPSPVDPRALCALDKVAYDLATPLFVPIEISPVCPVGTVSSLGPVSQKNVLTCMRSLEVVADSTNCLALECARRRGEGDTVRLCASHRVVRAQRFEGPASFAHFRLFSLCTAGRDGGAHRFEIETLSQHLHTYVALLDVLRAHGFTFHKIRVALTDFTGASSGPLEQVRAGLEGSAPDLEVGYEFDRTQAKGYYGRFCFWIFVTGGDGQEQNVGDGGFTDWTARLLANRKERLLISGLGSERLCYLYAPPP